MTSGEDAAMIAVRTGAALAVARSGSTRVAAFTDLVQGLMDAGVAVVGSVLERGARSRREEGEVSSVLPGSRRRRSAVRRPRARRWLGRPGRLRGDVRAGLLVGGQRHLADRTSTAHGALILARDRCGCSGGCATDR